MFTSSTMEASKPQATGQTGIIVVIPAHNEEGAIAPVILGAMKMADLVLVCDDGSTDLTAEVARRLGARVIVPPTNLGKGATLRSLMDEAKKLKARATISMDSDGLHFWSDIPALARPVLDGEADIVIGVRSTGGTMPRNRVIGNRILDEATSRKAGLKIHDTQSGFRAYSVKALAALDFSEKGMAVESQTLIDAVMEDLKIVGVPVSTTYEGVRKKRSMLGQGSGVLDYILSRTVVESPLLYLGVPGAIAILAGIVAGILVVNTFLRTHLIATGTGLIAAILIVTGSIALATGLILKFLKVQMGK